ncbi:unnamed protein product [Calypogeia fissa]
MRLIFGILLTIAEYLYVRPYLWPPSSSPANSQDLRGLASGLIFAVCIAYNQYIIYEVLLSLNHILSEFAVFIAISILSYYQAPSLAFAISTLLQIVGLFLVVLYADFDSPLKLHLKTRSSPRTLSFLVKSLKLKYFECSNPIEKRVIKTDHFLTTGNGLCTQNFTLSSITELNTQMFSKEKVQIRPAGPLHTLFTIEGVQNGVLVKTSPQLEMQKELLEYIANHPEACFAKEVHGSRGKYWSLEEYPRLLSKEIFVCRFKPRDSSQGEIDGIYMF